MHATISAPIASLGPVLTERTQHYFDSDDKWLKRRKHIPMGRLGQPDEVAGLVCFLCQTRQAGRPVAFTALMAAFQPPIWSMTAMVPYTMNQNQLDQDRIDIISPIDGRSLHPTSWPTALRLNRRWRRRKQKHWQSTNIADRKAIIDTMLTHFRAQEAELVPELAHDGSPVRWGR